jgi:hypothetical protein
MSRIIPREILEPFAPFYHITPACNETAILREGLRPDRWDAGMYAPVGLYESFVCVSTRPQRNRYVSAIQTKYNGQATVLLEIRPEVLQEVAFCFDSSSSEADQLGLSLEADSFEDLLAAGVPLVTHMVIDPKYLVVAMRFSA